MKLGQGLILSQTQKLILTPELRQAIELLQFTNIELKEYIDRELEENPMLEKNRDEEFDEFSEKINWGEYFTKNKPMDYGREGFNSDQEYDFSNFVSYNPDLKENLLLQLNVMEIDREKLEIGHLIIENINENGYFKKSKDKTAGELNQDVELVEEVLILIQTFYPSGVGARTLEESLLIQVEEKEIEDELVYRFINKHLEDMAENKLKKISEALQVSMEKVKEICCLVRGLNPKPGQEFGSEENIRYISPDAYILKDKGEYKVILNESTAPKLEINNFYLDMLESNTDRNTVRYLNDRYDSAMWVIKTIEQRRNTILKVLNSILKFQIDFFEKGEKYLKPLTLKEIAEEIDMHESTVSRTTNGKYVQTDRGLFEFKYFFSSSLSTDEGDVSSTSIKVYIEDIIREEDKKKPYSDQKIADILKDKGVKISRRTVAKYRDELNIGSSSRRKRY